MFSRISHLLLQAKPVPPTWLMENMDIMMEITRLHLLVIFPPINQNIHASLSLKQSHMRLYIMVDNYRLPYLKRSQQNYMRNTWKVKRLCLYNLSPIVPFINMPAI